MPPCLCPPAEASGAAAAIPTVAAMSAIKVFMVCWAVCVLGIYMLRIRSLAYDVRIDRRQPLWFYSMPQEVFSIFLLRVGFLPKKPVQALNFPACEPTKKPGHHEVARLVGFFQFE